MAAGRFYAITFGALVIFLGPGSMFFHGGLTHLGGWLDNFSMILFISFILLYDAFRIWKWEESLVAFSVAFAAINVALGLLTWLVEGSGTIVFAILAVAAVLAQAGILIFRPGGIQRRFWPWLASALVAFLAATTIWRLSWTAGPLCDPNSLAQGHVVWHLLAMAVTPFLVFLYLRDETRT
jgi:hypothetical protein